MISKITKILLMAIIIANFSFAQNNSSEKDKQETVDWILNKFNKYSQGIAEDRNQSYWESEIQNEYFEGLSEVKLRKCTRYRFVDSSSIPKLNIDVNNCTLFFTWQSYLTWFKYDCKSKMFDHNDWEETLNSTHQTKFDNVIKIPINKITEITDYKNTSNIGLFLDFRGIIQAFMQYQVNNEKVKYVRKYHPFEGDYNFSTLTINLGLQLITGNVNGVDVKSSRFSIPFNFSEEYNLPNRILTAINHLKEYCKQEEKEKF